MARAKVQFMTSPTASQTGDRDFRYRLKLPATIRKAANWIHNIGGTLVVDKYAQVIFHDFNSHYVVILTRLPNAIGQSLSGKGKTNSVYKLDDRGEIQFWGRSPIPRAPGQKITWTNVQHDVQSGVIVVYLPKSLW